VVGPKNTGVAPLVVGHEADDIGIADLHRRLDREPPRAGLPGMGDPLQVAVGIHQYQPVVVVEVGMNAARQVAGVRLDVIPRE
jgi:hypothetical protein